MNVAYSNNTDGVSTECVAALRREWGERMKGVNALGECWRLTLNGLCYTYATTLYSGWNLSGTHCLHSCLTVL